MGVIHAPALLAALLAIPIVLLYLLRLRRREQPATTTFLWRQALLEREANTPWQRFRPNVLLLLQLLTLACLVFALARPYLASPGAVGARTILLLDASASMQATDVSPSRFEVLRRQVAAMIEGLGIGEQLMLIVVNEAPYASRFTDSKLELREVLAAARSSPGSANWRAALALAQANGAASPDTWTVILSDGSGADEVALLRGRARFVTIGARDDNLSVSTLSLRRVGDAPAALVRVTNHGSRANAALVTLRDQDGRLLDARSIELPPNDSVDWTVTGLPPQSLAIQATIERAEADFLPLDNQRWALITPARPREVMLISRGNLFLEQALAALPDTRLTRAPALSAELTEFDIYVVDNTDATPPAGANVLWVGRSPFDTGEIFTNTLLMRASPHPLLQSVDWRTVRVVEARQLKAPDWLLPLVEAEGGSLLWAGEDPQQGRVVVLPFALQRSDLPLQLAFPLLMLNSVNWLTPAASAAIPSAVSPGQVLPLPEGARVRLPSGEEVVVTTDAFDRSEQVGLYTFTLPDGGGGAFVVNFAAPQESLIAPRAELPIAQDESTATRVSAALPLAQREVWHILAALALVLLVVEWWLYQRGLPLLLQRLRHKKARLLTPRAKQSTS